MTAKALERADAWANISDGKCAHKLVARAAADESVSRYLLLIVAARWAIPASPVELVACVTIGALSGSLPGRFFTIARDLQDFFDAELHVCSGAGEEGERHCARLSAAHAHCRAQVFVVGGHRAKDTTPRAVTVC